jgi:hypothetical protein
MLIHFSREIWIYKFKEEFIIKNERMEKAIKKIFKEFEVDVAPSVWLKIKRQLIFKNSCFKILK